VYAILSFQLLITGAVMAPFIVEGSSARRWARDNSYIFICAWMATIIILLVMGCFESARRKFPINFIFLIVFTVCEGVALGTIGAFYETDAVAIAAGITFGITLVVTLFSLQTKWDFTACGGVLLCLTLGLLMMGMFMIFFDDSEYAMLGYATAGAILISLYMVYDTQLMLYGKHKYSVDPEEYIFAAVNIYTDITTLFLYILAIVGICSDG